MQTLEAASNESEFIVKWCLGLFTLLNDEPNDVGHLICRNSRCMADAPQRACGHFCTINELHKLSGVSTHLDNEILVLKSLITSSTMSKFQAHQQ